MHYKSTMKKLLNSIQDSDILSKLIRDLDPNSELFERLNMCGEERGYLPYRYNFRCNQPSCPSCRSRFRRRIIKDAQSIFSTSSNSSCGFFTIILRPSDTAPDACAEFDNARQKLRNIGTKYRQRWQGLRIVAALEMDAIDYEGLGQLSSQRSELLDTLGCTPAASGAPVWLPSIHGIVQLNGVAHQEFRDHLAERWRAPRQVHVEPFYEDRSVLENVAHTLRYATKHLCATEIRGALDTWPSKWISEYYSALYSSSKGFRSITYKRGINIRKEKTSNSNNMSSYETDSEEPLPYIIDKFNY